MPMTPQSGAKGIVKICLESYGRHARVKIYKEKENPWGLYPQTHPFLFLQPFLLLSFFHTISNHHVQCPSSLSSLYILYFLLHKLILSYSCSTHVHVHFVIFKLSLLASFAAFLQQWYFLLASHMPQYIFPKWMLGCSSLADSFPLRELELGLLDLSVGLFHFS